MHYLDKPRVLVVDDEPSICQVLKRTLEQEAGYEVATACTGTEAEARFRTEWFDLLVLDLRLKEGRGDQVYFHAIACQPHLTHQTIFITGDITAGGRRLISETGCPQVMKPWNVGELTNLLHSLLTRVREASA